MPFLTQGNTNWKFLLIVVVLAVIAGGGVWFLSNLEQEKPIIPEEELTEDIEDETADWLTYKNEEYGFEFSYPPIPPGCENCKIIESDKGFNVNTADLKIKDSEGLSLTEFVDNEMEGFIVENKKDDLIDGKNAITVDYRFSGMNRFGITTFLEGDGNNIFMFSFRAGVFCCDPAVDIIYELEVHQAMLSTFEFKEPEKTTLEEVELPPREPFNGLPCTGLQAYKSGQSMAGLSINVPEGWKVNYFICLNEPSEVGGWEWAAIHLDFAPPGWQAPTNMGSDWWMGWGSIFMHVYDYQPDIETWITEYLSDYKDTYNLIRKDSLGGRPYFILESSVEEFWVPQHIILGTEYSYSYGTSQDGFFEDEKHNFASILIEEIFPHISIK